MYRYIILLLLEVSVHQSWIQLLRVGLELEAYVPYDYVYRASSINHKHKIVVVKKHKHIIVHRAVVVIAAVIDCPHQHPH